MKNYYSILEIQENASETLIKSQYKKLAFIYHPDKNPKNTDKFMDLNKAYKTLIDPILREYYNRDLREFNKLKESQPGDKIIPYRTRLRDGGNINIEMDFTDDILDSLDSTGNELIAKTLILQRYIRCPDCDGEGKKKDTLARVCAQCNGYGMVKNRETKVNEVCQSCNGYGDIFFYKCATCNGMGRIKKSEEITLNFKKENILSNNTNNNTHSTNNTDSNSIVNNKIIVFNGKGDEGVFGGKNGNIVVLIKINNEEKESFFKRLFLNKK